MLSDVEKGNILVLKDQSLSIGAIARKIGRSHKSLKFSKKNPDGYGKTKHKGCPRKLSAHSDRKISREISGTS